MLILPQLAVSRIEERMRGETHVKKEKIGVRGHQCEITPIASFEDRKKLMNARFREEIALCDSTSPILLEKNSLVKLSLERGNRSSVALVRTRCCSTLGSVLAGKPQLRKEGL